MSQWDLAKSTGVCAASGRSFEEGEEYYTVLFDQGDSFRRADYALDMWPGPPPEAFCFFKTRVPQCEPDRKKRLLVNDDLLVNLFLRLADQTQLLRQQFRFVLALILMCRRLLRYEQVISEADGQYWQVRLVVDKSVHRVLNPKLTDEQIEQVAEQLKAIFQGDLDAATGDETPADAGDEPGG